MLAVLIASIRIARSCSEAHNSPNPVGHTTELNSELCWMFSAGHQGSSAHYDLSGTHSDVRSVPTCISTVSTAAGGGYALKGLCTSLLSFH